MLCRKYAKKHIWKKTVNIYTYNLYLKLNTKNKFSKIHQKQEAGIAIPWNITEAEAGGVAETYFQIRFGLLWSQRSCGWISAVCWRFVLVFLICMKYRYQFTLKLGNFGGFGHLSICSTVMSGWGLSLNGKRFVVRTCRFEAVHLFGRHFSGVRSWVYFHIRGGKISKFGIPSLKPSNSPTLQEKLFLLCGKIWSFGFLGHFFSGKTPILSYLSQGGTELPMHEGQVRLRATTRNRWKKMRPELWTWIWPLSSCKDMHLILIFFIFDLRVAKRLLQGTKPSDFWFVR